MDGFPPELLSALGTGGLVTMAIYAIYTGRMVPRNTLDVMLKVLRDRNDQLMEDLSEAKAQLAEGAQVRDELLRELNDRNDQLDGLLAALNRGNTAPISPAPWREVNHRERRPDRI